jgi:ABC-2 type transport system permease protein
MTPVDFILGYTLPLIPIALTEGIATYIFAVILGLDVTVNILFSLVLLIPVALLYIALGLLCGSVLNDKQVGGICGALLTNLSAWLSGIWFDLDLVGGAFKKIAYALPFVHSVEMQRAVIAGDYAGIFPHLWWVLGYAIVILIAAVLLFLRQMKKQ